MADDSIEVMARLARMDAAKLRQSVGGKRSKSTVVEVKRRRVVVTPPERKS